MDYETTVEQYYEKNGSNPPSSKSQFSCPVSQTETMLKEIKTGGSYGTFIVITRANRVARVSGNVKLSVYDAPKLKPEKESGKPK